MQSRIYGRETGRWVSCSMIRFISARPLAAGDQRRITGNCLAWENAGRDQDDLNQGEWFCTSSHSSDRARNSFRASSLKCNPPAPEDTGLIRWVRIRIIGFRNLIERKPLDAAVKEQKIRRASAGSHSGDIEEERAAAIPAGAFVN